jgi:hypothetical protein
MIFFDNLTRSIMKLSRLAPFVIALSGTAILFAGCTSTPAPQSQDQPAGMTTEKKGDTTLTGKLTNKGGKYFLERVGQAPQEVDSYGVDLSLYTDQNVTITGQFSGDTLYAGKVEAQQ